MGFQTNRGYWYTRSADAKRKAAHARNIMQRKAEWLAADPTRETLIITVMAIVQENTAKHRNPGYFESLLSALDRFGSWTEAQERTVKQAIVQRGIRDAEYKNRTLHANAIFANSKHVGAIGERRVFALKLHIVRHYTGRFGDGWVNVCMDDQCNMIVCIGGQKLGSEPGEIFTLKGTVKAHEDRDGLKQTLINRPVVISRAGLPIGQGGPR